MINPLRRGTIALVSLLALTATAQAAGGGGQPEPSSQPAREIVPPGVSPIHERPPTLIDVDFEGGTLAEFVAAVRAAAAPKPLNVMFVADASADREMPAVTFRQVTINNALDAISWVKQGNEGPYQVMQRDSNGGEPIYVVQYEEPTTVPPSMRGLGGTVRVFMIRDLIEAPAGAPDDPSMVMDPDSLLTAVDAVLASVPEYAPKPTVLFHPESATLIVTAPGEQLSAITDMLHDLQKDIEERRGRASLAAERTGDAELRLRRAEIEVRAAMEQIDATQAMLQSLQDRITMLKESGEASPQAIQADQRDATAAKNQLAQLRAQLQMKQIEQQVAQSDLDAARQGVAQPPAAAEPIAANYRDPVVLRARSEFMAIIEAIRNAAPAGGLPTINSNTDQGLTITATAPQHAILHAAVEAMKAAAGEPGDGGRPGGPGRPAKNHRE